MRLSYCAALSLCVALVACGDDDDSSEASQKDGGSQDGGGGESGEGGSAAAGNGGEGGGGAGGSASPMDGGSADADTDAKECGNGKVESGEDCDDDNTAKGDGCDDACQFESGWLCSTDEPTACSPRCGDGKRLGPEAAADSCDDHDRDDGDGCDSDCHIEPGFKCSGEPSACTLFCGNSVLDSGEACDDGNMAAGDGCAACAVEAHWSCNGAPSACTAEIDANVLVSGLQLAALPSRKPGAIQPAVTLTGLVLNDTIMAIDRRPINGMLYGLGYNGSMGTVQLYLISSQSGACTAIGAASKFVAEDGSTPVNVSGTQFGMDFNPAADRIRVIDNQAQNFRINPNTGAIVDGSASPAGTQPDAALNGATSALDECAYTNNSLNQTVTTLYTIDHATRALYIQKPPNAGTQTSAVALPLTVNFVWGFDIAAGVDAAASDAAAAGTGYAVITEVGASQSSLARVNLANGALSNVTPIGTNILGLALQNLDAIPIIALTADGTQLLRFKSTDPGNAVAVPVAVASLTSGETLVDIDYRPATGQLMGLGINGASNTGTLYVVDPSSGALAVVGSASQIAFSSGGAVDLPANAAAWSIDFNPNVDALRVTTSEGLNFRVNPTTGAPIDSDSGTVGVQPDTALSGLGGANQGAAGAAYTNAWAGATVTSLYVLDANGNKLCRSSNPNGGSVTDCVAITSGGQAWDVGQASEIDFAADVRTTVANTPATGLTHAAMSVGGKGHLFSIDLTTGIATDRGQIGTGVELTGLAVGHATVK